MTKGNGTSVIIDMDMKTLERHLSSDDESFSEDTPDQLLNMSDSLNFLDSMDSDDEEETVEDKMNRMKVAEDKTNAKYHKLRDEFPTIRRAPKKKRHERTDSTSSTSSDGSTDSKSSADSGLSDMSGYSNDWRGSAPALTDYFDHSTPEFQPRNSMRGRQQQNTRPQSAVVRTRTSASESSDYFGSMDIGTGLNSRQQKLDSRLDFLDEVDLASTTDDEENSSHEQERRLSRAGSIKDFFGKVIEKAVKLVTKSSESLNLKKSSESFPVHMDEYAIKLQLESPIRSRKDESDGSPAQPSSTDRSLDVSLNFLNEHQLMSSDDNDVSDRIDGQLHFLDSADSESTDNDDRATDERKMQFLRLESKYYLEENSDSSEDMGADVSLTRASSFSVGSRRSRNEKQGPPSPSKNGSLHRSSNSLSRSGTLPRSGPKKRDASPMSRNNSMSKSGSGSLSRNNSLSRVPSDLPSRSGSITRQSPLLRNGSLPRSSTSPLSRNGSQRRSLTPQQRPSILSRWRNKDSESSTKTVETDLSDEFPTSGRIRTESECSDLSAVIDVQTVTQQPPMPPTDEYKTSPAPMQPTTKPAVLQRQVSHFLSKSNFAGIPFAILYGVTIYFFIAFWILPPPTVADGVEVIKPVLPPTVNASTNNTAIPATSADPKADNIYKDQNASEYCTNKWLKERQHFEEQFSESKKKAVWPTPSPMNIGIAASSGFVTSLALGVTSVYSQGTRCVMVLVLPNLLSGRGRAALMTLAIGFLIDGPLDSIQHNIQRVAESLTCLYRLLSQVSCRYNKIVDQAENGQAALTPTTTTKTKASKTKNGQTDSAHKKLIDSNVNGTTIALEEIKDKIFNVVHTIEEFTELIDEIFFWLKRVLLILSVILLVRDSIGYYKRYYSDVRFDNMVVDRNLRKLWRRGAFSKLTPLRNWELNKHPGYKVLPKLCVSWNGVTDFFRAAWPTSLFIVLALFFLFLDYGIANLLEKFCSGGSYDVSFAGLEYLTMTTKDMDFLWSVDTFKIRRFLGDTELTIDLHNVEFPLSDLNEFVIQTKPCLPLPVHTDWQLRTGLVGIMLFACLTHLFDMVFSRAKNWICNLFFDGRADERANDLYRRLLSGREQRMRELSQIVMRELKKRHREKDLSIFRSCCARFWSKFRLVELYLNTTNNRCPGCGWKKKQPKVNKNNNEEDVEEAKEVETLKRRSRRNSIASSMTSLEEAAQYSLDCEDGGGGMRHAPSVESIVSFLQESADESNIKRSPKSQKKSPSPPTVNGNSPTTSDEDMSRGFLVTLICIDCKKDMEAEKTIQEGVDAMDGTLSRLSLRSASISNVNRFSEENDNSMITDQDSLGKYLMGGMSMWT